MLPNRRTKDYKLNHHELTKMNSKTLIDKILSIKKAMLRYDSERSFSRLVDGARGNVGDAVLNNDLIDSSVSGALKEEEGFSVFPGFKKKE